MNQPQPTDESGSSASPNTSKLRLLYSSPKNLLLTGIVLLTIAAGLVLAIDKFSNNNPSNVTSQTAPAPSLAKVTITKDGFVPAILTVKAGTVVIWTSTDESTTHKLESNPHPTHTDNPGLSSTQLGNGAEYRYKFTAPGTTNYHDELNPLFGGSVVVE